MHNRELRNTSWVNNIPDMPGLGHLLNKKSRLEFFLLLITSKNGLLIKGEKNADIRLNITQDFI